MAVYVCEFYGGEMDGKVLPLDVAMKYANGLTDDWSEYRAHGGCVPCAELDNQPTFEGYLGPMYDGERILGADGNWHYEFERAEPEPGIAPRKRIVLRYETQEVYDVLSR